MAGSRRVRAAARRAISMHIGNPPIATALKEEVTDGFVVGGGPSSVMHWARLCEQVNMPFWIQQVGTEWTTMLAAHIGAVCSHAQWPAVTSMNMFTECLVTEPIKITEGHYRVSDIPGLGIEFNEESMKSRWGVQKSSSKH